MFKSPKESWFQKEDNNIGGKKGNTKGKKVPLIINPGSMITLPVNKSEIVNIFTYLFIGIFEKCYCRTFHSILYACASYAVRLNYAILK